VEVVKCCTPRACEVMFVEEVSTNVLFKGWFWALCNISTNLNIKWKSIKELDLCIAYTFLLTSYVRIWYMQVLFASSISAMNVCMRFL